MGARSVRRYLAGALLACAVAWGLVRFGATEPWSLCGLFLLLAVAGLIALTALRLEALDRRVWLPLTLAGAWILTQVAFRPTLAAQGYLHLAVGWLALALALWLGTSTRRAARWLFLFLVFVGVAEAAFALLELSGFVSAIARNPEIQPHLAVGTLINPNHFSGLVNMALALAFGVLAMVLSGRAVRGTVPSRLAGALPPSAAIGLMALATFRAESHGGNLALMAALAWMIVLAVLGRWRRLGRRLPSRGRIVVAALAGLILTAGAGVAIARSGILSLQHRAEVYRETLAMIRDQPLSGVGPGMYMWCFRPYQAFNVKGRYFHAHNDYLQSAAEWGIPVALVFWAFVFWRLHRSAHLSLESRDSRTAGMALGCSGAIAAILVHSLVDFNLQIPGNLAVFAIILGIAWSLEAGTSVETDRLPPGHGWSMRRVLARVILPLLLLAAGAATARQLAAIQQYRKVPGLAGLEGASQLDPRNPDVRFRLGLLYRDDLAHQNLAKARRHLEAAVRLNPHAWMYRLELGSLYELLGLDEQAAGSYREALRLNPESATYHWRAANFLLRRGDLEGSLPSLQAALADPRYSHSRGVTLHLLLAGGATARQIFEVWPADGTARLDLLSRLVRRDDLDRTSVSAEDLDWLWSELLSGPEPPTPAQAGPFLQYLIDQERYEAARGAWLELAAARDLVDESFAAGTNYLWNGSFELPMAGGLLGWQRLASNRSAFTPGEPESRQGSSALRVDMRGDSGISSWMFRQLAIVDPGVSYRVSLTSGATAAWQEFAETTLTVRDRRNRRRLLEAKVVPGSADGARRSYGLEVPSDTFLIEVQIEARSRGTDASTGAASWWLDSLVLETTAPGAGS